MAIVEEQPQTDEIETVSDDVVHAACDELGVNDPVSISNLTDGMRIIANAYLADLSVEPHWGSPKSQRAALRKLADAIARALRRMSEVSPEYAVNLHRSTGLPPSSYVGSLFEDTRENMIALVNAIDEFDRNYVPKLGAQTNIPLETAVRDLIDLIKPLTGSFPQNAMEKHSGKSPRLKSREALAIGKLLRGANKSLSETTVVNMIEKIAVQPLPTEDHLDAVFRADPYFGLNRSLFPNRERE